MESLEARLLLTGDTSVADLGPSLESYFLANSNHHTHAEFQINESGRGYYVDNFYDQEQSLSDGHFHGDGHDHGCTCAACCGLLRTEAADQLNNDLLFAESADDQGGGSGSSESANVAVPISEIPQLSSNPSAPNTFYLDFLGERVVDTDWNRNDNDGLPIHARPYDTDGDVTTFSQTELDAIVEIWQRVSEDFAPFDINITTIEPPEAALEARRQAIRGIITTSVDDQDMGGTGEVWFPNAGGVAFVGSWLERGDVPVWIFQDKLPDTPKGVAEAVSHEFGHALGLSHHGDNNSAYYNGHGTGETSWAPIMGAGYRSSLTQWSDGKYESANNAQNDLQIITNSFNHVNYRADDHLEGNDHATMLEVVDGLVSSSGIIEQNNDYDTFGFEHEGGAVNLQITPSDIGGNLDVTVFLFDSYGDEIQEYSPEDSTSVTVAFADLEAGTYFLDVEGGGFSPDEGLGYSDYGSLGSYTIEGTLGVAVVVADTGGLYEINEGTDLILNGSASIGTSESSIFSWDLDGDGEYDDAEGEFVVVTWEQLGQLDNPIIDDGDYTVGLQVQGDGDLIGIAESTLRIANVGPVIEGLTPLQAIAGAPVTFELNVTDIEADPLNFSWELEGEFEFSTTPTITHTFDEPGEYTVNVSVGDDAPVVTEQTFTVIVSTGISGDADFDGRVTFADFLVLSSNFGQTGLAWTDGDFTGDGNVSFDDFLRLSENFGTGVTA